MIHKAARAAEPAQPILWVVVIEPAQAALVFNAIGSVERGTTVAILAWGHAVIVTLKCPFGQPQPESVRVLDLPIRRVGQVFDFDLVEEKLADLGFA